VTQKAHGKGRGELDERGGKRQREKKRGNSELETGGGKNVKEGREHPRKKPLSQNRGCLKKLGGGGNSDQRAGPRG